jgi:hypothetical protein
MLLAAIILRNMEYLDAAPLTRRVNANYFATKSARQGTHWPTTADRPDRKDERLPLLIAPEQLLL